MRNDGMARNAATAPTQRLETVRSYATQDCAATRASTPISTTASEATIQVKPRSKSWWSTFAPRLLTLLRMDWEELCAGSRNAETWIELSGGVRRVAVPPLSFGHFPRERGKTWDSATFYQCKRARGFRLQQLGRGIHSFSSPFANDVGFDAVFVDGDADAGAFGQLECAVGEFPSGVGSILQQV